MSLHTANPFPTINDQMTLLATLAGLASSGIPDSKIMEYVMFADARLKILKPAKGAPEGARVSGRTGYGNTYATVPGKSIVEKIRDKIDEHFLHFLVNKEAVGEGFLNGMCTALAILRSSSVTEEWSAMVTRYEDKKRQELNVKDSYSDSNSDSIEDNG